MASVPASFDEAEAVGRAPVGTVERPAFHGRRKYGSQSERRIALTSKLKPYGLGQYGAEPHILATLPFWQLCALNG